MIFFLQNYSVYSQEYSSSCLYLSSKASIFNILMNHYVKFSIILFSYQKRLAFYVLHIF